MRRITTRRAILVACSLAAAGGGAAAASASAGASAAEPTGSATLTIVTPAHRTRTLHGRVSCQEANGSYRVRSVSKLHHGRRVVMLTVTGFHGPSSYKGRLSVIRYRGIRLRGISVRVPVQVSATGGSLSATQTLRARRHSGTPRTWHISGQWTCSG
jgi:hypothetical protein